MAQQTAGYLYTSNIKRIKASATVSGSADSTGVDISTFDCGNGLTLIFDCSAVAGGGSLAIAVAESDDDSSYSAISGATITVAVSGVTKLFIPNVSKKYIRLGMTLTGTSVTFSCVAIGVPHQTTSSEGYTTAPTGQSGL